MDTSLAGMLIMAVLLSGVVIMSQATIASYMTTGTAVRQAATVSGERERTIIVFDTATSTGANLTVDLDNTGSTSVSDYANMDFIVTYQGGGTVVSRLGYVTGAPAANQWTRTTTTPDLYQPGIWDPGEKITLDAVLSPVQDAATSGMATVSTPNGVVATGSFTRP